MSRKQREVVLWISVLCLLVGSPGAHAESTKPDDEGLRPNETDEKMGTIGVSVWDVRVQDFPAMVVTAGLGVGSYRPLGGGGGGGGRLMTPHAPVNDDTPKDCDESTNLPVVITSGNKILEEVDFVGTGEMPLSMIRYYSKNKVSLSPFGRQWTSSFHYRLLLEFEDVPPECSDPEAPITIECSDYRTPIALRAERPDGSELLFHRGNNPTEWVADKAEASSKITLIGNRFQLYNEAGGTETYDATPGQEGRILSIMNARRIGWTFEYPGPSSYFNRVTHSSGRQIQATWNLGDSALASVTDPDGQVFTYDYSKIAGIPFLTGVNYPGGLGTRTYHYEDPAQFGGLTGLSINGVRYSYYTYHPDGRVHESGLAGGAGKDTFSYGPNYTDVTNALGHTVRHNYTIVRGLRRITSVDRASSAACPAAAAVTGYDERGYVTHRMDWTGNRTNYQYNDRGQLLEAITGIGPDGDTSQQQIQHYIWDEPGNRVIQMARYGKNLSEPFGRIEYEYFEDSDAAGRGSLLKAERQVPCANGSCQEASARSTTYDYTFHPNRMMATITMVPPIAGAAVTMSYSANGDALGLSNTLGHTTTYSGHNGRGQFGRIVGANGETIDYTYDALGRIAQQVTHFQGVGSRTESFGRNGMGSITSYDDGSGASLTYTYDDAGRLMQAQEWHGPNIFGTTAFNRDLLGNPVETTVHDSAGILIRRGLSQYDAQGFLQTIQGNTGQSLGYAYDGNGNVVSITDALGQTTRMQYDALSRQVRTEDPLGGVTTTAYDAADRVTHVTDPRGNVTSYSYDGFGQRVNQISPDTGTTAFGYDAMGLMISMTRHDGSWLLYDYDSLGRLTSAGDQHASRTYSYDLCEYGKGRLCAADYAGGSRRFGYTTEGQLATIQDQTPQSDGWTRYSYDSFGRLAGIQYPGGTSVGYGYQMGRLSAIEANISGVTQIVVNQMQYSAAGQLTRLVYGHGLPKERAYDLDGRLTQTHDHAFLGHNYQYNTLDELTSIENWSRPQYSQSFGYDPLSRLTGINAPVGNQQFTFDANGNRTFHQWLSDETYLVDLGSNRLLSSELQFSYDGRGNRASQQFSNSTTAYNYDSFNRLASVSRDQAVVYTNPNYVSRTYPSGTTTYTINALDQRVAKSGPLGSSRFFYSGQNMLMSEHTDGQWSDYIWMGREAIGLVRGGQLYFVHADRLGRPEIVSHPDGQARWIAANHAYDREVVGNSLGEYNLGLPGQYFDAETGHWYNGFRDYDGRTGSYLQSDPIGLAGGLNTYAYVMGNPISLVDPLGLESAAISLYSAGVTKEMPHRYRGPDYLRVQGGLYVAGFSLTLSRSGNLYASGGFSRNYSSGMYRPGASVTFGNMNSMNCPTPEQVDNHLEGLGFSAAAFRGLGGAVNYAPGNGSSTEMGVGISGGVSPGGLGTPIIETGLGWGW